jgi:hypothetical protein
MGEWIAVLASQAPDTAYDFDEFKTYLLATRFFAQCYSDTSVKFFDP